ncbi:VOC family protein [Micromonospora echinofusca]|uniref:VOC family protein n=1 Tax=Micromonospora echinofusca TaxID=47858 RepID=A0ABS3VVT2_MICEH|nr:VOC family protein [Micromonospora echinofusca]MBO4208644.1 VOC family protein [Micromonospora echinofusca]
MQYTPVVVALPIADRATSYRFYQQALGLVAPGDPAEDGVPEPLRFEVNPGLHLMFVPSGGFGWVIGDREIAAPGQSECVLTLSVDNPAEVDDLVGRARAAGARVVGAPGQQPWGYVGSFADPDGHLWMVQAGTPR